ncbi:hypothetical protein [Sphaerisporangium sp. NPDC051011]|uniref:hypothetical protein n=1 Tax=Sphaerisporangium sp. NPDC051011 TaxID=3155792 RepID=UPI0033C62139
MSSTELELRIAEVESMLGSVRDQAVAASYVAGQASGRAEAASGLYMAVVDDLKGIRVQQNLHTVTLAQHSKILDGLATTVHEHTRTLEEQGTKLDEILDIVRTLK